MGALDDDYDTSRAAVEALGKLGDLRVAEPLSRALGNDSCDIRCAAEALAPLVGALGTWIASDRVAVAQALAKLGAPEWQQWIRGDEGDFARLGTSQDVRAVEPLIKAMGREGSGMEVIAQSAARALGNLGYVQAVEPLIKALGAHDAGIRQAAAEALGELGDLQAVQPLIGRLAESGKGTWGVRRAAGISLISLLSKPTSIAVPDAPHLRSLLATTHADQHKDHALGTYHSNDCHCDHVDSHRDEGVGLDVPAGWPKTDF